MTRDEIIAANPIEAVLAERGVKLIGSGNQRTAKCPFHQDKNPSFSVNIPEGTWHCHVGCGGGSVIDLLAKFQNRTPADILRDHRDDSRQAASPPAQRREVAVYRYQDANRKDVFEVVRFEPKTFRQRHKDADGNTVWGMDGVERVLYRLPDVLAAKEVWIVEGEKDADNLAKLGFCGTCNVGGAGKWLDSYTGALEGKDVVLCGDNDAPGKKHVDLVLSSIGNKVASARIVNMPLPHKDVSDYIAAIPDAPMRLKEMAESAQRMVKGIALPIFTLAELESSYKEHVRNLQARSLDLGKWLPSLGRKIRNLVPGELVAIIADTGVGKTAIMQNIAVKSAPLKTLMFELELPGELMFERFLAIRTGFAASEIEAGYREGDSIGTETLAKINHLYICTEARMSVKQLEDYINRAELKIGERPKVVVIDYAQLIEGTGKTRYERMSNVAEDLKIMAKATKTIVIFGSQIARKSDDDLEIHLHEAKDSGAIENSSGLVLGAWRPAPDAINVKILKNTKGRAGDVIACTYEGSCLRITEKLNDGFTKSVDDWMEKTKTRQPHAD